MHNLASRILVLLVGVACSACHEESPRSAVGCRGPQLEIARIYMIQESEDGSACVRLSLGYESEGIPGVTHEGDFVLDEALRVSTGCDDVGFHEFSSHPSAFWARTGRGQIRTAELSILHADVELDLEPVRGGSSEAVTARVFAEGVDASEPCPLPD